MKNKEIEILYRLFRDHEDRVGATRTAILSLEAFAKSIEELKCTKETIRSQMFELSEIIRNSEPKIVTLIHLIEQFEAQMEEENNFDKKTVKEIKRMAVRILERIVKRFELNLDQIAKYGEGFIEDRDVIVDRKSVV